MKSLSLSALLVGSLLTLAAGCQKTNVTPDKERDWCGTSITDSVFVRYNQTYCADAWGQAQGAQQLQTVAQAYLGQQGIRLRPSAVTAYVRNPASVCNACSCTTGLVVDVAIIAADLPAMQALGFTRF